MSLRIWSLSAVGLAALAVAELRTDYTASRTLRYEAAMEMEMETTSMRMERDGQPVEIPGGGGGMASGQSREITWTDKVLEHKDGKPTKVLRVFGDLGQTSTMNFGGNEQSNERKGALDGVTLELTLGEDGKVEATAKEGDAPGESLVGHHLTLALDAFLPEGDVADGDSWELDTDALRRGLALDLGPILFPPQQEAEGGGGEGGGGGGRGSRGPRGGGASSLLAMAALEGKATLTEATEEVEGVACRVIKLEISAEGELEEPSFGGGGRGRAFGLPASSLLATTYEIELEGKLFFDAKSKLPVSLELEGTAKVESRREGESRGGGTFKMESVQEGDLKFTATVSAE